VTKATLAAALLALPALAAAHDLRVERAGEGFAARYGHRGGEALEIDPSKVMTIRCAAADGAVRELPASRIEPRELRFAGPCAAASVFLDGGYWSLTPDGEVNQPRTRTPQAVKAWASRQWAKWVDARSPGAATVLGDGLELVPVSDLSRVRAGGKVTLRVLAGGRPVAGAVAAIDHHALGETDSRGEVRLRVRGAGVQSITASLRRPLGTPEADTEVLEASLTFEVAR
jgi:hypothetical protein